MQRLVLLTVSAAVWPLALGCGNSAEVPEGVAEKPQPAAESAEASTGNQTAETRLGGEKIRKTVEAGCAKCQFNMKGIESHELAVKIDGKPYIVTGEYIEPAETGLCEEVKNAQVVGQIIQYGEGLAVNDQTGEFHAESIQLEE